MPDNIWRGGPDGPIWVALAGPRVPALDLLQRAPDPVRRGPDSRARPHPPSV
ncbi:hypothetical protein [Streptomyces sp. KR55]|uniref:hypothetical protein n=1 Tax=Streptomyces sp. KR55 TaxID=3457425 RepID=UPI003FD6B056